MATAPKLEIVPTLADLLHDPLQVAQLPRETIAQLRGELARLDTLLLSRLFQDGDDHDGAEGDKLLNTAEAASRLGVSEDYLYRHHKTLAFTRRVGRKLLFSAKGIEKYISQRARP